MHFPGADKILKGAVSAITRGLGIWRPPAYAGHTRINNANGHCGALISLYMDSHMPAEQKKILRDIMKEKRKILFQDHPNAGEKIVALFFNFFDLSPEAIVGGYWPMKSELDIKPLLNKLLNKGFRCALPCITSEGLIYRAWTSSTHLEKGTFHAFEPPSTAPVTIPNVLLVPLLAFDKEGHRLGYGQGHFDRFLHQHKVLTIGVGFKGQEVEKIPRQDHDFALDYILTEEGVVSRKKHSDF